MQSLNSLATHPNALRDSVASTTDRTAGGDLSSKRHCRLSFPTPCGFPAPCGMPCDLKLGPERHAVIDLGNLARLAVLATPSGRGSFRQQADEVFAQTTCLLSHQSKALKATTMMVFLKQETDRNECAEVIRHWFGNEVPVTTYVVQPLCDGAAIGIELWAVGGSGTTVERLGPQLIAIESDGIRWVHCGGIYGDAASGPYAESLTAFQRMQQQLATAGVDFDQVARTWIYINDITVGPDGHQRYQELNHARTDFFKDIHFGVKARAPWAPPTIYPASTGIGTQGTSITMSCMALDSKRPDVFLMPLENPQQTPAFDYQAKYSPQSPKFSRAMAVVQGHFVATLVSGTASIVNSKTFFPGDIARQTEQTIENIERLIAPDNFARHGLLGAGATLGDIAKLRVYIKHIEDYEKCRAVCEKRLPGVPVIYLHADVCRPDLLVEIEAVAFSPVAPDAALSRVNGKKRNEKI